MAHVPLRGGERLNVIRVCRGKPVVPLHGFGSKGSNWLHNVLPYQRQFEFFLQDLLNHFELDDVILGGISTGTYTCLIYNQVHGLDRAWRKKMNYGR